jgi:hypothetical protein
VAAQRRATFPVLGGISGSTSTTCSGDPSRFARRRGVDEELRGILAKASHTTPGKDTASSALLGQLDAPGAQTVASRSLCQNTVKTGPTSAIQNDGDFDSDAAFQSIRVHRWRGMAGLTEAGTFF